ncbi:hypothetical protein M1R45_003090 [Escherichia coli]|nr:hypothetical protein [Escherichia coli]
MKQKSIHSLIALAAVIMTGVMPVHAAEYPAEAQATAVVVKQCLRANSRQRVTIVDSGDSFNIAGGGIFPLYVSPFLKLNKNTNLYEAVDKQGVRFARSVDSETYTIEDDLIAQYVDLYGCETIPDPAAPQGNDSTAKAPDAPATADQYDGDNGSEFAERGDIARPENAGANMFTGDLYDEKGDFVKKVVLIRAANDDITLVINDGDKKLYKKDNDMAGKLGTYGEPRMATEFYVAEGRTYEVTHTVLVK